MSATFVRVCVLVAAAAGLVAAFLLPMGLSRPAEPAGSVRRPAATLQTTVESIFPAPGRPESSPDPVRH